MVGFRFTIELNRDAPSKLSIGNQMGPSKIKDYNLSCVFSEICRNMTEGNWQILKIQDVILILHCTRKHALLLIFSDFPITLKNLRRTW